MHELVEQKLRELIIQAKDNAQYYEKSIPIPQDENAYIMLAGQLIAALANFKEHHFAE